MSDYQNYLDYIDKNAETGEQVTEQASTFIGQIASGNFIGAAVTAYNSFKTFFGGTPKDEKDRQAKIAKFFNDTFTVINPTATSIITKLNSIGGTFAMVQKANETKSYNYMTNVYAYYIRYNSAITLAQGYVNGVYNPNVSNTDKCGAIDQSINDFNDIVTTMNNGIAKMKSGLVDPISFSTYRPKDGKYMVDRWNGVTYKEIAVTQAERLARVVAVGGNIIDLGNGSGGGSVGGATGEATGEATTFNFMDFIKSNWYYFAIGIIVIVAFVLISKRK